MLLLNSFPNRVNYKIQSGAGECLIHWATNLPKQKGQSLPAKWKEKKTIDNTWAFGNSDKCSRTWRRSDALNGRRHSDLTNFFKKFLFPANIAYVLPGFSLSQLFFIQILVGTGTSLWWYSLYLLRKKYVNGMLLHSVFPQPMLLLMWFRIEIEVMVGAQDRSVWSFWGSWFICTLAR